MKIRVEVSFSQLLVVILEFGQLFVKLAGAKTSAANGLLSPFMGWVSNRAIKRWSSEC
jgi:hypothetical protein